MKTNPKAVAIRDVASKAGVSIATVSRFLNRKDDISEGTINRVLAVVQELDYASNLATRGMRSYRTNMIGPIVPNARKLCAT